MSYEGETAYITGGTNSLEHIDKPVDTDDRAIGGACGIARSLATGLVSKGMRVFIADRNIQGAEETAKELNKKGQFAWAVQVDVTDWESQEKGFQAAVQEFGHIDYVFASARIIDCWDVNGAGALYSSALAVQQFRRQEPNKYGFRRKMVIVASACRFYYITPLPIYTASKHAIVDFVRTFGKSLAEEKITLNAICPNIVKTNISTGDYYDKAEERGLLITLDSLLETFESLLGTNDVSGEAIEVLPGDGGHRVKEIAEYTNEKVKESVELTIARSQKRSRG